MTWTTSNEKPKETCSICGHPPHGARQCLAMGVSTPCPCAPGVTSKEQLDELWIERNEGRTPWGRMP